jgi:N-ethylmaleimide reductase
MTDESSPLFTPVKVGDLTLPNRIAMAPLTRNRAIDPNTVPSPLAPLYYRQRASAGLLISEATQISQQGQGYAWTPGVFNDAQVEAWKKVTEAVHEDGGHIFVQLWHVGRISHTSLQPNGGAPVSSAPVAAKTKTFIPSGFTEVSAPRALETHEIAGVIADYANAAAQARRAGFDGVEIHGANGYLLDQFARDSLNHRTDAYGGSIENRLRLALEATDAVLKAWPAARVGYRISPVSPANDLGQDSNPQALYGALTAELSKRNLAYLHVVEGATGGPRDVAPFDYAAIKRDFSGAYIANNGYDREMAIAAVKENRADLIAFGKPFISNPDLVARLKAGAPLAPGDQSTYYGGGAHGYTDYPEWKAA